MASTENVRPTGFSVRAYKIFLLVNMLPEEMCLSEIENLVNPKDHALQVSQCHIDEEHLSNKQKYK